MTDLAGRRLADAVRRTQALTVGRLRTGTSHDDADDLGGTIDTDDAIGFDPRPVLASLDRHGARVVVMGQVAGILHGSVELTGDLDLLWSGQASEAGAMAGAFSELTATLADDDGRPLAVDRDAFTLAKVVFRAPTTAGDCCTPALPWGELDVTSYLERADTAVIDGVTVRYLTRADLLAMRRVVGRPKDLRRATELEGLGG